MIDSRDPKPSENGVQGEYYMHRMLGRCSMGQHRWGMGSLSLHPMVETNQINILTHLTSSIASPTSPKDTYSAIKDKDTHVAGNMLSGSNKRKWNRQSMYNLVKKTVLGHVTVTPPPVDGVTQYMGTSNMNSNVTLVEGKRRHIDSKP